MRGRVWILRNDARRSDLLEIQEHAADVYVVWLVLRRHFGSGGGLRASSRRAGMPAGSRRALGLDLEPEARSASRPPFNLEGIDGRVVYEREVSPFVTDD